MGGFASLRVASGISVSLFGVAYAYCVLIVAGQSYYYGLLEIQVFRFGTKDGKPGDSLVKKHSYVLQPVSGNAKYSKLRQNVFADSSQPLQKAAVNLDDVTLCLSKVQFNFFLFLMFCGAS